MATRHGCLSKVEGRKGGKWEASKKEERTPKGISLRGGQDDERKASAFSRMAKAGGSLRSPNFNHFPSVSITSSDWTQCSLLCGASITPVVLESKLKVNSENIP
jgi:hypothetical protein